MNENDKQAEPVALEKLFAELLKATYSGKESYYNDEQISDACYSKAFEIALVAKKKGIELYTHPSPVVAQSWELDEESCKFLADMITADPDQITRVGFHLGYAKDDDGKLVHGFSVYEAEYPEEGVHTLVETSPAQPVQPAVAQEQVGHFVFNQENGYWAQLDKQVWPNGSPISQKLYKQAPAAAVKDRLNQALSECDWHKKQAAISEFEAEKVSERNEKMYHNPAPAVAQPLADVVRELVEALQDIAATGYSNIDRDKARAALAAAKKGDV